MFILMSKNNTLFRFNGCLYENPRVIVTKFTKIDKCDCKLRSKIQTQDVLHRGRTLFVSSLLGWDSCFITDQLCRFRALSLLQSHTLSFTYYNAGQHYLGPHQRAVMLLIAVLSQYYRPRAYTTCIAETHGSAQRHIICVVREPVSSTQNFGRRFTFSYLYFPLTYS